MALPHFVLLYVDEPQKSAAFYARLLGRKPLESSPTFVMFELAPGLRLGLWVRSGVKPAPRGAGDADWKDKGALILQAPETMDFGLTVLAADPDGHRLRVFCPAA